MGSPPPSVGGGTPDTLISMHNLAVLYKSQHHYVRSEQLHVKTLELRRRVLGEEHLDTLMSMNNLGELYRIQGQYAKSELLHIKALEVRRRILGESTPHTDVHAQFGGTVQRPAAVRQS